ncbi:hypothetical protein L2X99_08730 [Microbacterium sp. KUDC0406]|uniref:hypothetical protein n=1 Tax=Microbacterium sp. KUDC0406 TaxID=2909588 RepID=UPI001F315A81|nr:hypothetical protein [Microbacterium sp. KUDC0406]UJP11551.1 hypothetical protein L2X99_08730 [Microbacterium sp. KUDC0406]
MEVAAWTELPPWEKYLVQVHAAAMVNPDRVFCHESAAALLGVLIAYPTRPVHVLTESSSSRLYKGVRTHTSVDDREAIVEDGIALTAPLSTAVDLARSTAPAEGLAYADALMRIDTAITRPRLLALNEDLGSGRGRQQARWPLGRASGIPESVLESASLAVIEWLGYEVPVLQKTFFFEGFEDRTDFYWAREDAAGEADGLVKYTGEFGDPSVAIIGEKTREDRLRRHLAGFGRWGWDEVVDYDALDATLRSMGLRPVRPRDTMKLSTLRRFGAEPPHETARPLRDGEVAPRSRRGRAVSRGLEAPGQRVSKTATTAQTAITTKAAIAIQSQERRIGASAV